MEEHVELNEIAQLGDPVLRQQAEFVQDTQTTEMLNLVERMLTVLSASEGVGIAAPQIFQSYCVIVIASRPSKRYPLAPEMKPVVMINPTFEVLSQEVKTDWEGCLSVPGIRGLVPRYIKIHIRYIDHQGKAQKMVAEEFVARIFQHEYDHLHGLVYLDRVKSNRDIVSELEFQKIIRQRNQG